MINIEPQLTYTKAINKGVLNVVFGGTYRTNNTSSIIVSASDYKSDILLTSVAAAGSAPSVANNASVYKYIAGFGRINYIWDSKYILNLTGNRNGSSNFGPNRRFGNFGSAGAGWIISEENFIKKTLPFISFAKLSGNYGTSGSDGVAPYQYQANWAITPVTGGYQGNSGYNPANPLNPEYAWATNKKFNESLDLGFLKDRILLNFTLYQDKSDNQLVAYTTPIQAGFSSLTRNAPYTVENKGFEISLVTKNITRKDFQWTTNFNIAHNANVITKFPGLENSPYANYYVLGKSALSRPLVPFLGVNPTTGIFEYRKADGTVTNKPNINSGFNKVGGDATELVDLAPKFTGGFMNTFTYKDFSLSMFFQFAKQKGNNYLYSLYGTYNSPGNPLVNLPIQALNRWQKPGDVSSIQRLTEGYYTPTDNKTGQAGMLFPYSTGAYSDASYIRLKNVSLAYNIPASLLRKTFIKHCQAYINAQNIFLITGYEAGDPETLNLYSIPPQRTFVAGLNINL